MCMKVIALAANIIQVVALFGGCTVLLVLLLCIMLGVLLNEIEQLAPGYEQQTTQRK